MTRHTAHTGDGLRTTPSRNMSCPCGSGQKYKLCCGAAGARPKSAPAPGLQVDLRSPGVFPDDAFTEAGRLSRSADLLRRELDAAHGGATKARLAEQSAGAVARDPKAARAHRQRGLELLHSGQIAESLTVLRKAVLSDPQDPDAHHALGSALLHDWQFAEAVSSLSRAVTLKPDFALAYRDLGNALDRQGSDVEATEAFQHALALSPKLPELSRRVGELYEIRGYHEQAATWFRREAAAAPNTTSGRLCLAKALSLERNVAAAEALLRKAIVLDPANGEIHSVLADMLVGEGHIEEGADHYERSLRLDPKLFGSLLGLVRTRKLTAADQAMLARIRAALAQDRLHDVERMMLHFTLGKALDDLRDYAGAMHHFDAANEIRDRPCKLDRAQLASSVDRLIRWFTPEQFARLAAYGTADETPLLIVGMPRSGTTLVEQIISSHPAITAGDELPFWVSHGVAWEDSDGAALTQDTARSAAAAYLALLRRIGPSAVRVTDKLPFNFRWLGLIHTALPAARIIHCRRHPVDTCLSIYSTPFKAKLGFVGNKANLAFYYQQYARLMDHWRAVLPADRFIEVEYERLIADRETETRRLIAFTGLDWDPACLQPERNARTVRTASAWQARQPVYTTSVERWRHYKPWLGELRELLAD